MSPKVSINILTKDRPELLARALASVIRQSFQDYEVLIVIDGSVDTTLEVVKAFQLSNFLTVEHQNSIGISKSRPEALEKSKGEYIAILDDDDEWVDVDKLKKQVEFLDSRPEFVLVGGGIKLESGIENYEFRMRAEADRSIRQTMLFRNNFFTSTVMFRREAAIKVRGFVKDEIDLAEDYDLWLRLGQVGKMYNFQEVFTMYAKPKYNKEKFVSFLKKQLELVKAHRNNYPNYLLSSIILRLRMFLIKF